MTPMATSALRAEAELPRKVATVTSRTVSVVRADERTGRLVRSIVVTPRVVASQVVPEQGVESDAAAALETARDAGVRTMVEEAAKNYSVNPALVDSVIQVESNYNPYAVSPKGAQGLMQLMPATARRFGVKNSFDPRQNIEGGVRYLKFLQDTFQDERLAIAAYNAGEMAVVKYGNVPPYRETMNYVAQVGKKYGKSKRALEAKKAQSQAAAKVKPPEEQYRHVVQSVDPEGRIHLATQ